MTLGLIHLVVALIAVQRLAELGLARRNTRALLAEGAVEIGARHYPLFVILHASWLAALLFHVPPSAPVHPVPLAGLGLLMLCRLWVMASLGRFWTTRIITLPGAPLIRKGPYRWVRHPNYLVVSGEIALAPLAFGAWEIAVLFSILNGALLAHRIAVEDGALAQRSDVTARGSSGASG